MGLRTLIKDLAGDAYNVVKKVGNVAGDVTGVKQFASGISDAIVTRQYGDDFEERKKRAREQNEQIMQKAMAARKAGNKEKAKKLLSLASDNNGPDLERDVLGHSFDESIHNTKVGAAKLAATAATAGIDAVPVATAGVAKFAPGVAKVIEASPTARLGFASTVRGLENAFSQAPIDLAEGGVKQAKENFGTNMLFGTAANVALSPKLLLKSGKEIKAGAGKYEVGLTKGVPGQVQLNSGLPVEIRKKGTKAASDIIEEADKLAAIHTVSAEKLKKSVDAGGFPAPSIAVKKNPEDFEDFGKIQVIFGKDTIDPKLNPKNKVFGDDIYSPRVPRSNTNEAAFIEKLKADPTIVKYANDNGISLERVLSGNSQRVEDAKGSLLKGMGRFDENHSVLSDAIEKAYDASQQVTVKKFSDTMDRILGENAQLKKYADNAEDFEDFAQAASSDPSTWTFLEKKAKNYGLEDDPYEYLQKLQPHFEEQLPLTAENYVKLLEQQMRGADVRVQEGGFSGQAPLTARLSKQFDSVEDIKAATGRLTGVDAESKAKEALVKETDKIAKKMGWQSDEMSGYSPSEQLNHFLDELQTNFAGKMEPHDIQANAAFMKASGYRVPEIDETKAKELSKFLKDVSNQPAYYFEAKPMRVVGTDEVRGVMVPDNQYEWLAEQLKGTDLENKIMQYADAATPELRTANRAAAWKKFVERDPNAFFGMAAGIEPTMDDQGNITGFTINPEKAAGGMVIGSVASSKGGRELIETLLQKAKGSKTLEEFKELAQPLLQKTEQVFNNAAVPLAKTGKTKGQPTATGMKDLYNLLKAKGFEKDKGVMSYVISTLNGEGKAIEDFSHMVGQKASSKQWRALFAQSKNRAGIDAEGFTKLYANLTGQKPSTITKMVDDAPDLEQLWNQAKGTSTVQDAVQVPSKAVRTGDPEIDNVIAQAEKDAGFFSDGSPVPTSEFDGGSIPPASSFDEAAEQMQSGKKLGFVETVEGAKKTPDALRDALNKMDTSFDEITNKDTLEAAVTRVGDDYEGALARAKGSAPQTADSVAEGLLLMDDLIAKGRVDEAAEIAENMARKAKDYGQANQALAMYSRLTPAGALRWAERTAERVNALTKNTKNHIQLTTAQREAITSQAAKLQEMNTQRSALASAVDNLRASADQLDEEGQKALAKQVDELTKFTREKDIESAKLVDQVARIIPPTLGQKFADFQTMAQLLNPKTAIRNIVGNVGFMGAENVSDVVATGLDMLFSAKTGIRTKALPSLRAQGQGMKQGWKLGLEDALRSVDTANYASQFDLPKTPSFRGKAGELFNKMLSVELKATDRMFYTGAYTGSVENQLRASGNKELLAKWNTTMREEGFQAADKIVPDSVKEIAHFDGLYRTFQDDNVISNAFQGIKKTLNLGQEFGYGDFVMKYPKTPANIIMRGLAYTPAGMVNSLVTLARTAAEDPRIRQRKFAEQMARSLVGTGAIATGYVLAKNGIITGKGDKDTDIEAVKSGSGGGRFRINLDAMKRYVASGFDSEAAKAQQGDSVMNYDWLQPAAIQLSMGANMAEDQKSGLDKAKGAGTTFIDSAIAGADTISDQGLLRGVRSIFGGYSSPTEALIQPLKDAPSSFIPGVSNQLRQYTDNTARSTYDPSFFGEAGRKVLNRIPGASTTLEPQMTVWGDKKELYQDDSNGFFNTFINPAFVSKMNATPEAQMVLDLYESSGETNMAPTVAKKKYKINGEDHQLTPEEYTAFQRYIGKKSKAVFNAIATNPNFDTLDEEAKIKMLSSYLSDIGSAGKIVILGNQPTKIDKGVVEILAMDDNNPFGAYDQGDQATGETTTTGGSVGGPVRKGKKAKHVTFKVKQSAPKTTKLDLGTSSKGSEPTFRLAKKLL